MTDRIKNFTEKASTGAFVAVIIIGIVALTGWLTDILPLAGMGKNSVPMAPATILCFLLTGFIALILPKKKLNPGFLNIILCILLAICLIILIDSLSGYPIGFERIFGHSPGFFAGFPIGLMSPVTSILFLISSISLLSVTARPFWQKSSIILSATALFVILTFDLGYLYGTPLLYGHHIIPPAWNTSIAFTLLFIGILSGFGMNEIPMNLFTGNSVSARLMRGFLPVTLFILILAGWFDTILFSYYNDMVLATALVTILSLFVLVFSILKLAKKIGNDIDHIFEFRTNVEEALRESELYFRTLADSGQALIWTSDAHKKCNYFNQPWLDFTGRNLEQELGDGWIEGIHPNDLDRCVEIYTTAFDRHERFNMDYRLRHNDGSYRWIQDNGTPRFNVHGEFVGYIGHCLDISERKSAEAEIGKLNEELEQKVKERTIELEQKNADLERMNKLFTGRELRMIELKNEIKELKAKLRSISG